MGKVSRISIQSQIWDTFIGQSRDTLPLNHLPLTEVVLQRFRGIRNNSEHSGNPYSVTQAVQICWDELKHVWDAARIPTILEFNGKKKINKLIEWFSGVTKNKKYLEDGESSHGKEIIQKLHELFNIAPANVRELMQSPGVNPEWITDYDFFRNQMEYPQTQVMAGVDHNVISLETRREHRHTRDIQLRDREQQRSIEQRASISQEQLIMPEQAATSSATHDDESSEPSTSTSTSNSHQTSTSEYMSFVFSIDIPSV